MNDPVSQLPADIARQIDPAWRKNRTEYWAVRNQLRAQHEGQWIGFADGKVVATGTSPVAVFHAAEATGNSPFVTCVGSEDAPCRIRRAAFRYDTTYPGEPLPVLDLEFLPVSGMPGIIFDSVIPDTGADASVLPWADCQRLGLAPARGRPSWVGGVVGGMAASLIFSIWVKLDGQEHPCRIQADFTGRDRIVGRDVLNRLDVLFRGAAGEVIVNP